MTKRTMSYVIACWKKGLPYGIQVEKDKFSLVPLDSPLMYLNFSATRIELRCKNS